MNIHHQTQARAEKAGINLMLKADVETGEETIEAFWPQRNRRLSYPDAKVALALMTLQKRFGDEYANVRVEQDSDGGWATVALTGDEATQLCAFDPTDFDSDAVFADTLEQMVEQGIEAEEAEGEPGEAGNIVPRKYREAYAAAGHANTCGDWLANILNEECTAKDEAGKTYFNIDRFDEIYDQNKGDRSGKWCNAKVRLTNGWQGRYRMSGRIALAKIVGINKYLQLDGKRHTPPAEWLAKFQPKEKPAKETKKKIKAAGTK